MDKNKIIETAAKLVAKGAYDKAIKEYQKILDVEPKDVRVLHKIGELYQKKNDNPQAAHYFTKVAASYASDGAFLRAVTLYKMVLKLTPAQLDVNLKLAELHQQAGLISEAMAYFQIVANHYDKQGDTKQLLDTLKRMVDLDPENVASKVKLGELYAREGLTKDAVVELKRAAENLKRNARMDDYLRVTERMAALEPENIALAKGLAKSYLEKSDWMRALARLQVAFKADGRDVETLNLLAQAFQGLGQISKTVLVYKELAKVYQDSGLTQEANGVWGKVAELDPQDADLLARPRPIKLTREQLSKFLTETDVYIKYGLHNKALEHLRNIFSIDPENLDAHEKAYSIYVSAGNSRQAGEQLLNVLRLCTRRAEVQRAQPYLATILRQNPNHPEVPAFLVVLGNVNDEKPPSPPEQTEAAVGANPPRVFISYSHDSAEHKRRVLELAERFREDGIDCRLDRFVTSPPEGWPIWCESELKAADKVLVVCTEKYYERFYGIAAPVEGLGVQWEGTLIRQLLYESGARNTRFIPVIFDELDTEFVPLRLRDGSRYLLHADYEALYAHLIGRTETALPPLGQLRPWAPRPNVKVASPGATDKPEPISRRRRKALAELTQRQAALYAEKEALAIAGEDIAPTQQKILEVKRLIREGGQLQQDDMLDNARFRLLEIVGQGGFGTVWRAYDRYEQELVAIKVLHGQYVNDSSRKERFFRGARQMAKLSHPGIVRVVLQAKEDHGFFYFVMEYVSGMDLRRAVARRKIRGLDALNVVLKTATAVQHAHQQGIIHRDLTPGNILLEGDDPKLTDFDLVWAEDTTGGTRTGVMGKLIYIAPEMSSQSRPNAAMDVYGLGMCAVFSLYGKKDLPLGILSNRKKFIEKKLRCSTAIKRVLIRAVEVAPKKRFAKVSEFIDALEAALREEPGS